MLCVRRWSDAGRRAGSGVCYSTVPRAQNRAAKGSTLLQRRSTLPILLYEVTPSTSVSQQTPGKTGTAEPKLRHQI